ncbi:MAG: hypothetical protein HDS56_03105 [Barnesiella sp.]|nr:hypothetical protein [Barnesiella sp.]MBD5343406.1 hypothetical protein [Bacteroides sp.]MBD5343429.1 hypothetical protein [Bacteroides sp.]
MEIPVKVKEAAQYLIDIYGDHVEHLGQYQGAEAFYYRFPDDITAGYCPVYLHKSNKVDVLTGEVAYHVLLSFIEDFDESGVE